MEDSHNPMTNNNVYEKFSELSDEIQDSLRSYCSGFNSNNKDLPDNVKIEVEISNMKDESYRNRNPEYTFTTLLFRKYVSLSNKIKYKYLNGDQQYSDDLDDINLLNHIPKYIYQSSGEDNTSGWDSLKRNIFWLRANIVMFSFLSYVMMLTVSYISWTDYDPTSSFTAICQYSNLNFQGSFDYRPYHWSITASVLVYLFNLLFVIYYILPIDETTKNKFIPGAMSLLENCLERDSISKYSNIIGKFMKKKSKIMEMIFDIFSLLFVFFCTYAASNKLVEGVQFEFNNTIQYYSIDTFYSTLSHTNPICLEEDDGSKIKWSLSFLYIVLCFLTLTTIISIKSYLKYKKMDESEIEKNNLQDEINNDANYQNKILLLHSLLPNSNNDENDNNDNEEEIDL